MINLTKQDILNFWNKFYIEENKEDIDEIIEMEKFDINELKPDNLDTLSQEELNQLMKHLVYLFVNAFEDDYEEMYYCLSENEDGIYDNETVNFLLD